MKKKVWTTFFPVIVTYIFQINLHKFSQLKNTLKQFFNLAQKFQVWYKQSNYLHQNLVNLTY